MKKPEQSEASEPRIPAKLAERLKVLGGPAVFVPPQVDEVVLAQARRHFANAGHARRVSAFPRWLAAAAAVALCAWLGHSWLTGHHNNSFSRDDINRDGRVDILDAFALARRLQSEPADKPAPDINGDGVVDQRDIDALAAKAVKLAKGQG